MKAWIPSIVLTLLMFLLIAATRVYVGGPDGLEFVWKGELSFADTVVNVVDFQGMSRKDLANHHSPSLIEQMDEMDLLSSDSPRHKRRIKKNSEIKTLPETTPDNVDNSSPENSK